MKHWFILILAITVIGCKRYKDSNPFTDARINNPYCNTPSAINYNWGFPGVPDSSLCIFPSTFFSGSFLYHDSMFDAVGNYISKDSFPITITIVDTTKINITGFCGSNVLKAKADKYYKLKFDSTFSHGQHFCNTIDTVTGGGSKKGFEDSLSIKFNFTLKSNMGVSYHAGTAIKQ